MTLPGFLGNAWGDLVNIGSGVVNAGKGVVQDVEQGASPSQAATNFAIKAGKGMVDEYGNLIGVKTKNNLPLIDPDKSVFQSGGVNTSGVSIDPKAAVEHAYQHPVNTALDVLPAIGALKGLRGASAPETAADASGGATGLGNKFIQSQYKVSPSVADKLDLTTTVQKLADNGHTYINDIPKVANQVTGANGIITKMTRKAIAQAGPVNLDGVATVGESALDQGEFIPDNAANKFRNAMKQGILNTVTPELPQGGEPLSTFDFAKNLESKAAELGGSREIGVRQLGHAYQQVADELKDRLFSDSGANDALVTNVKTPEDMAALEKISPQLAKQVRDAQTVADLRSTAAPYVRGNKLAQMTINHAGNSPVSLPGALELASTIISNNPAGLGLFLAGTNTGKTLLGNAFRGAGDVGAIAGNKFLPPIVSGLSTKSGNQEQDYQGENTPETQGNHSNQSISYQFPDVKPNTDGSWTLDKKMSPAGGYMSEAQFQEATAGLSPESTQYRKVAQQFQASQQQANEIIGRKGGAVGDFMNQAEPGFRGVTTAQTNIDKLPTEFWDKWKQGVDVQKYFSDPKNPRNIANAMVNLTKINDKFSDLYSHMEGVKPSQDLTIQAGDPPNVLKIKLDQMANYIKGYYKLYEDPWLAVSTATGTANPVGNAQSVQTPPKTAGGVTQNAPMLPPTNYPSTNYLPPIQ